MKSRTLTYDSEVGLFHRHVITANDRIYIEILYTVSINVVYCIDSRLIWLLFGYDQFEVNGPLVQWPYPSTVWFVGSQQKSPSLHIFGQSLFI